LHPQSATEAMDSVQTDGERLVVFIVEDYGAREITILHSLKFYD
jgi:hypothetical protein